MRYCLHTLLIHMDLYRKYDNFVSHPRFGSRPRFTGVQPEPPPLGYRQFHHHSSPLIPGTAVKADLQRQAPSPVPVTHYFDLERTCQDCKRQFLFFAEEQKYWYEELGFPLDSNCVRCVPCRKHQQAIAKTRARYEELLTYSERTHDETAELAECCLKLVEENIFTARRLETVRMLLNRLRKSATFSADVRYFGIVSRLAALEKRSTS